jgi:hypothetical protein
MSALMYVAHCMQGQGIKSHVLHSSNVSLGHACTDVCDTLHVVSGAFPRHQVCRRTTYPSAQVLMAGSPPGQYASALGKVAT